MSLEINVYLHSFVWLPTEFVSSFTFYTSVSVSVFKTVHTTQLKVLSKSKLTTLTRGTEVDHTGKRN